MAYPLSFMQVITRVPNYRSKAFVGSRAKRDTLTFEYVPPCFSQGLSVSMIERLND